MPVRTDWTTLGEALIQTLEGAAPEAAPAPAYTTAPAVVVVARLTEALDRAEAERASCGCPECTQREAGAGWNGPDDPHRDRQYRHGGLPPLSHLTPEGLAAECTALRRWLTPAQWTAFLDTRHIRLTSPRGVPYVLRCEPSGNIYRGSDGARLCMTHPSNYAPLSATLACQVYLLTHDEAECLRRCNVLGYVAYLPASDRPKPPYHHHPISSFQPDPPDVPRVARQALREDAIGWEGDFGQWVYRVTARVRT